jgi:hypothetical protein
VPPTWVPHFCKAADADPGLPAWAMSRASDTQGNLPVVVKPSFHWREASGEPGGAVGLLVVVKPSFHWREASGEPGGAVGLLAVVKPCFHWREASGELAGRLAATDPASVEPRFGNYRPPASAGRVAFQLRIARVKRATIMG